MRLLFVSNYFPPEVNAPATRLYEHARQWVADGHEVEVLTSNPNFPEGAIYDGYANRLVHERVDGIDVTRVPMYVAANTGTVKRTLSFVSFMLASVAWGWRVRKRPDLIVATSPQFFGALGGWLLARLYRVPFVLEIRDIWPESIVAVGAVERGVVIRVFEWLERFLYRQADEIVVVTDAFKRDIEGKGIDGGKISVVKNGVDARTWEAPLDEERLHAMATENGLEGRFVAAYVGTIGMAHGVEVMLEAAARCGDPDVLWVVVGTGGERDRLARMAEERGLDNFRLLGKMPKEAMPYLLALTDVSVVHLKASPLFETVIPSKIFEAMATGTPIAHGVRGESREIVERSGGGIAFPPEDAQALVDTVLALKRDPDAYAACARDGRDYVRRHFDRRVLARDFWRRLEDVHARCSGAAPVSAAS